MTGPDVRQSARLVFPKTVNWVVMPPSFPFGQFTSVEGWAQNEALSVHYQAHGRHAPMPEEDWYHRTWAVIAAAQRNLMRSGDPRYRFLVFYDPDAMPIPVSARIFLADLPWEDVLPLYTGAQDDSRVEGPVVDVLPVAGAEAGVRARRLHPLDPEAGTVTAVYDYAFRIHGIDVFARAEFLDLTVLRPALPVVDAFVQGIEVAFGEPD
jgi:hypothetical protein